MIAILFQRNDQIVTKRCFATRRKSLASGATLYPQFLRYRALNPRSPEDAALLEAISRGEVAIAGLRNRDLADGPSRSVLLRIMAGALFNV